MPACDSASRTCVTSRARESGAPSINMKRGPGLGGRIARYANSETTGHIGYRLYDQEECDKHICLTVLEMHCKHPGVVSRVNADVRDGYDVLTSHTCRGAGKLPSPHKSKEAKTTCCPKHDLVG